MAVVTSATPDWMAALRAKKRDKKDDGPKVQSAKGLDSQPQTKSAWSRKFDSSKSSGSPSSRRTSFGEATPSSPVARSSAVQSGGAAHTTRGVAAQSSTLPRSFGRGSANAAPPAVASEKKRAADDSSATQDKSSTLEPAGRRAPKKEVKSSVSALRSLFNQKSSEPASSSPKLLSIRPRSEQASSASQSTGPSGDNATTTTTSNGITANNSQGNDAAEPAASSVADRLRRISEERDAGMKVNPAVAATGTKRKTSNEATSSDKSAVVTSQAQGSSLQQKRAAAAATAATRKGSATDKAPAALLQCTNIDDFIADKEMLRAFSLDSANAHRLQGSDGVMSAPASATGSPRRRERRHSILLTPDRKQAQPKMKRRVSFSELRLETVHQFQREEKVPSDDSDDEVKGMVRRAMVVDDSDGLSTELHPRLSPLSAGKPPKRKPFPVFVSSPEDDEPPDMYTDVPDSVAALLM